MPSGPSSAESGPQAQPHDRNQAQSAQRQPWRAVWPPGKSQISSGQPIVYQYSKGVKMNIEGSAGEAHMNLEYDTGNCK